MEQTLRITLIISLLTGFSQSQLPPGPINKEVGANVSFTLTSFYPEKKDIKWGFNDSEVIVFYYLGTENVNPKYKGITTILWMKDDEILASNGSITFLNDNRTIVISPVKRPDSGNYQCVMSNPVNSSTANYRITVNYGPDVKILGPVSLEEGSNILLLCSSDSVPPAPVKWTVKDMSTGNAYLYVTENSKPNDSGDYKCTCWNNVSGITASEVHILTVRAVSSRLPIGAEACITLGVVFAIESLVALSYLLIKHYTRRANSQNATEPSQETSLTIIHTHVVEETSKKTATDITNGDNLIERPRQPVYQEAPPTPPPRIRTKPQSKGTQLLAL